MTKKLTVLLPDHLQTKLAIERRVHGMRSHRIHSKSAQVVDILEKALADSPMRSVMALLDLATAAALPGPANAAMVNIPGAQPAIITAATAQDWAGVLFTGLDDAQTGAVAQRLVEIAFGT